MSTPFRKARTRTLIQLGGLIEKAGLLEEFGIMLGADLQKDPELKDPVAGLFGALLDLKNSLQAQELSLTLLKLKGAQGFGEDKGFKKKVS